jgi:hypothetical protein
MARRLSQSDPALSIDYFNSGFYTHRSQLFAPFRPIGVNVISLHDPVLDGANMEDTDLLEWQRRPGFSIFCPVALNQFEVATEFYGFRNLNGDVIALFDSNQRIAKFDSSSLTTIITKTTPEQGFETNIGSMMYFSDGSGVDMQKWLSTAPFSTINPSTWGISAPTIAPTIFNRGCWLPRTNYQANNAVLDPNGNVEVVVHTFGAGISGNTEPQWPTTAASTINDASVQWENVGPLEVWLPNQNYPVPVVVLDTNGNLQLATAANNNVSDWNSTTTYTVGQSVFFGGNYWTAVATNINMPPSEQYATPTWVLSQNPITTGPVAPSWNTTVGGTTSDGQYTWKNLGPGQLVESFGTSYVYSYRTIYGHLSTASPVSINTGAIFGPVAAAITSFSVTANVITFFGTNNFVPGNVFTVQGLTSPVGEMLNGQSFTIIAAGTSPTQFSAIFTFPNTALTQDSGSTLNLIAQVQGIGSTSPMCNATASITQSSSTANVVTIYANEAGAKLNFVPGLWVTLTGMTSTISPFLNNQQFQIINIDPNGLWFQILVNTAGGVPNQSLSTDSGTVTFNAVEIYRTSDGGGIYLFTGAVTNPSGSAVVTPYDSGSNIAGSGSDNGVPGIDPWTNPSGVASTITFATVSLVPPSGGGSGNFNIIQVCKAITTETATPSGVLSATFTNPVTAGNNIVVFVTAYDNSGINITDSQGNLYTQVSSVSSPNDHGIVTNLIYITTSPAAGGATTIQLTVTAPGSNAFFGFGAAECSGLNGSFQTTGGVYQASGTSLNTGTITTTSANTVVVSFAWSDLLGNSGNAISPPAGFPFISQGGNSINQVVFVPNDGNSYQQMAAAYQVFTSTTTQSPTWSTPSNSKALGLTVAFALTLSSPSDGLIASNYPFAVPPNISISGIQVTLEGTFTGTGGSVSVQLMKNGTPIGAPKAITPTGSLQTFVLGSQNDLWGATWNASDFNAAYGVEMQASIQTGGSSGTFSIQNVRTEVFGSTSTTGWVFNDFTPDANLDVLLVAPQNHLNDPPPGAPGSSISQIGTLTTYWNGRIWMVVDNYVYFDAGPDCTNGVPEEAWPPANRFQFSGPVLNLIPTADGVGLLVILADRINAILGGPETISFYPTDALSNFGISSPNSVFRDGSTIGLFTTQKQYFEIIGDSREQTGEHIADYLTANFDPTKTFVTMHRNGLDVGAFISNGVDQVLRFGSNIGAWSVPAFPVGGAGALRSIETSVGIMSLMLASPVPSVSTQTPFMSPTVGSNTGTGVAWASPNNIVTGSPTSYATVTLPGTSNNSALLTASDYDLNIPDAAIIMGVEVSVTGKQSIASSGLSSVDKSGTTSVASTNTLTVQLTPAQANEWALWASYDNTGGVTPYFPVGGGGAVDSFVVSGGVVTVVGENNLVPGQTVLVDATGSELDRQLFTIATASGTGWTANTLLPNASGSGENGLCSVQGWENLTLSGATYYTPDSYMLYGAPIGVSTGIFPSSTPTIKLEGTAHHSMAGILTLFKTNGTTPVSVNQAKINNGVPSHTFTVTAGNTILFWGVNVSFSDPGTPTITDTQGNLYTDVATVLSPSGTIRQVLFIASAGSSGSNTITVTWASNVFWNGMLNEMTSLIGSPLTIEPINPTVGAETDTFSLGTSNTTITFGGPTDLWRMPWTSPFVVNGPNFGFTISANSTVSTMFSISEVQVKVFYQNPGNYLRARDINSWGDSGMFGQNNGTPYADCFITIGSITMTQPGAPMFPLQHVVGYFDAAGNLGTEGNGGPSVPNVWIMPNEISTQAGIGFIQLPEVIQEPPIGQNEPSASLLSLRWPVNMFNSTLASQFLHHLQVKIEFEPENAPNTLKAMALKEFQE